MNKKIQKKGVSPVITSVVLVGVVIGMITIVFFWLRQTVPEGVIKLDKEIDLVCQQDVNFDAQYDFSTGNLNLVNRGNVPIFDLMIRVYSQGNFKSIKMSEVAGSSWINGLGIGRPFSYNIGNDVEYNIEDIEKVQIIPILIGKDKSENKKQIPCSDLYSKTINK